MDLRMGRMSIASASLVRPRSTVLRMPVHRASCMQCASCVPAKRHIFKQWEVASRRRVHAQTRSQSGTQSGTLDPKEPHILPCRAAQSAFDTIAIIALVPVYDRLLAPWLRWTYLQRIGWGLVVRLPQLFC